jgi:hypothetical protein
LARRAATPRGRASARISAAHARTTEPECRSPTRLQRSRTGETRSRTGRTSATRRHAAHVHSTKAPGTACSRTRDGCRKTKFEPTCLHVPASAFRLTVLPRACPDPRPALALLAGLRI